MPTMKHRNGGSLPTKIAIAISAFLFGCLVATMTVLNFVAVQNSPSPLELFHPSLRRDMMTTESEEHDPSFVSKDINVEPAAIARDPVESTATYSKANPFVGKRILIAIAAYNFNQIPHLGEVLDSYQDLCMTGASKVDVVIHATVAYPVTLIDLLNSRQLPECKGIFSIQIVLKPSALRLHLVDCHRELFYRKIDDYDLFIYTEDDMRVPPRVVGGYLAETKKVQDLVGLEASSGFNIGITRYEYNFPSNVMMDDKTRQATLNVSRVYWEHGFYPVFGGAVRPLDEKNVPQAQILNKRYIQPQNDHQGMFMATPFLLKAWKDRDNCKFNEARDRPGKRNNPHQPTEGTQRVWMSSRMLYGRKHCNVQQLLPIETFGVMNVLHLPNKNYRRVGKYHNRTFADGTEKFVVSQSLLTAMRLHIELRNATEQTPTIPYDGITMVDEVDNRRSRNPNLERRLREYQAYVDRGGILSKDDMGKTTLVENN